MSGVFTVSTTLDKVDNGVRGHIDIKVFADNRSTLVNLCFDALSDEHCKPVIKLTDEEDEGK